MNVNVRHSAAAAALAVVVVAAVVLSGGPSSEYRVDVDLASANGLRDGSVVKMGGAEVGTIRKLHIEPGDRVVAELRLDKRKAGSVTQGASARVVTSNLIGSKYIDLVSGPKSAPPVHAIAASRVTYPVDLDQVLDVLDASTRLRLQVLVNEAGVAFTGRAVDFNRILQMLPHDFAAAQRLINQLAMDNHSLGQAVAHSSRFVSQLATQRRELGRLVEVARGTIHTTAERRQALRETLARAPRTLATAQRFFGELRRTAKPLGPAARAISATAPSLAATLGGLPAFRSAAAPALHDAAHTAPLLARLGAEATPVVRKATPVLQQADTFSRTAVPLTRTLDVSIDDLLGIVEGWARSIEDRDALGHIFRGKAVISPDTIKTLLDHDLGSLTARHANPQSKLQLLNAAPPPAAGAHPSPHPAVKSPVHVPPIHLPGLPPIVLPGLGSSKPASGDGGQSVGKLLDYLLGT